jgi:hypothetical protein
LLLHPVNRVVRAYENPGPFAKAILKSIVYAS